MDQPGAPPSTSSDPPASTASGQAISGSSDASSSTSAAVASGLSLLGQASATSLSGSTVPTTSLIGAPATNPPTFNPLMQSSNFTSSSLPNVVSATGLTPTTFTSGSALSGSSNPLSTSETVGAGSLGTLGGAISGMANTASRPIVVPGSASTLTNSTVLGNPLQQRTSTAASIQPNAIQPANTMQQMNTVPLQSSQQQQNTTQEQNHLAQPSTATQSNIITTQPVQVQSTPSLTSPSIPPGVAASTSGAAQPDPVQGTPSLTSSSVAPGLAPSTPGSAPPNNTIIQPQMPKPLTMEQIESNRRLEEVGLSENDIEVARERLVAMVKRVDPNAKLSTEVQELLIKLSIKFLESTTSFACKLAQHRGSSEVDVNDLKLYVERKLGLTVPGFGATDSGNISASQLARARATGMAGRLPDAYAKKMNLKRKAHDLTPAE